MIMMRLNFLKGSCIQARLGPLKLGFYSEKLCQDPHSFIQLNIQQISTTILPGVAESSEKSPTLMKGSYNQVFIASMVQMNLFGNQKQRHRHSKQMYGYQVGKKGWDELGDWD